MQIERLDHFVLTTGNLEKCLEFYRDLLHMTVEETNGRYALRFGREKSISIPGRLSSCRQLPAPLLGAWISVWLSKAPWKRSGKRSLLPDIRWKRAPAGGMEPAGLWRACISGIRMGIWWN